MSLTPIQRANLIWASRPPGPAPLWHAVGSAVRSLGGAIDALGVAIQGDCAHHERLPIPCTAVKVGAALLSVARSSRHSMGNLYDLCSSGSSRSDDSAGPRRARL